MNASAMQFVEELIQNNTELISRNQMQFATLKIKLKFQNSHINFAVEEQNWSFETSLRNTSDEIVMLAEEKEFIACHNE